MTLAIHVDDQLRQRLEQAARRRGIAPAEYARLVLEQDLRQTADAGTANRATLDLLAAWDQEDHTSDPAELARRREEIEQLKRSLNENRETGRKPFP